ncbi:MAG: hypothetical protein LBN36_00360 [Clostridiales Family XIII bacterium]|jgi:hypothetical protein|nr:hypothetical protein [Clostridiales Family XIII bacterium]
MRKAPVNERHFLIVGNHKTELLPGTEIYGWHLGLTHEYGSLLVARIFNDPRNPNQFVIRNALNHNIIAKLNQQVFYIAPGDIFPIVSGCEITFYDGIAAIVVSEKPNKPKKSGKTIWIVAASTLALAICIVAGIFLFGNDLSNRDFANMEKTNGTLDEMRNSDEYLQADEAARARIVQEKLNQLAADRLIDKNSIYYDKEQGAVTFLHDSGVFACEKIGGFEPGPNEPDSEGSTIPSALNPRIASDPPDARILYATSDFPSSYFQRCQSMEAEWDAVGINASIDSDVTLDDLANLNEYEFVYVVMHGIYYCWLDQYNRAQSGQTERTSWLCLYKLPDRETDLKYKDDLANHRVGYMNGEYMISPDFFNAHYKKGSLDGNIFFFASCQFMGKEGNVSEDWTVVLNNLSVAAFVGSHNSNYATYNNNLAEEFMRRLIEGNTVQTAFDAAIAKYGENDEIWWGRRVTDHLPAYPLLRGNKNATLQGNIHRDEEQESEESQEEESEKVNDIAAYDPVMAFYRDAIANNFADYSSDVYDPNEPVTSGFRIEMSISPEEFMPWQDQSAYIRYQDLDGNEVPELLIAVGRYWDDGTFFIEVQDIWTVSEGAAVRVFGNSGGYIYLGNKDTFKWMPYSGGEQNWFLSIGDDGKTPVVRAKRNVNYNADLSIHTLTTLDNAYYFCVYDKPYPTWAEYSVSDSWDSVNVPGNLRLGEELRTLQGQLGVELDESHDFDKSEWTLLIN